MSSASREPNEREHIAARRILAVTEEELRRIVLDVHDGPVQQLFAALSQISVMQGRLARDEAVPREEWAQHETRQAALIGQALHEIRNFLGAFRPPAFASRDLAEVVAGLVLQHETHTGCQVEAHVDEAIGPVALSVKIAIYRICQEALANVYRHAGANQARLQLRRASDRLVLVIEDDGRGFVPPPLSGPEATERAEHIGLRGMRDRVDLVGGTFALTSAPGEGTRIVVEVPLE